MTMSEPPLNSSPPPIPFTSQRSHMENSSRRLGANDLRLSSTGGKFQLLVRLHGGTFFGLPKILSRHLIPQTIREVTPFRPQ